MEQTSASKIRYELKHSLTPRLSLRKSLPSLHTHTYTHSTIHLSTQDGVTADQVAEVKGHHAVCEELRKHMHGDRRPLSKVSPTCVLLDVAQIFELK